MIGKITLGKSFSGCIKYCLEDKIQHQDEVQMKNRAEVLMYNKCYGIGKDLVQQFNEVRQLNTHVSKPVLHITLSLAFGENLGKDKLMEMCEQCAKEIGFENNQFIAISHRDTDHQHLHIVANRIGFDRRTVSDSNNYKRMANYCRKMELEYNLQQVLNPKKFLPNEQQSLPRFDRRKEQLRQDIKDTLKSCYNFHQFEAGMMQKGYRINKGRGISFTDEKKVTFKGSQVNFSLQTIQKILAQKGTDQDKSQAVKLLKPTSQERSNTVQPNDIKENKESRPGIIEGVISPERIHEQIDKNFLPKKRKKKRSQHL